MDPNRDPGRSETYNRTLCGEFVAALGTAALDECPSRACSHARAEAVLALAATVVWLIRTLHSEVVPGWGESRYFRAATERGYSREVPIETTHRQQDAKTTQGSRNTGEGYFDRIPRNGGTIQAMDTSREPLCHMGSRGFVCASLPGCTRGFVTLEVRPKAFLCSPPLHRRMSALPLRSSAG